MTFSDAVSELMANARNPYKMGNASLQVLQRAVGHLPDERAVKDERHGAEDQADDDPCPPIVLLISFDISRFRLHGAQTSERGDCSRIILPHEGR
jgi:hypothetical protein